MKLAIGLDMKQIGGIVGATGITVSVLIVISGWLADRFHVIRVVMAAQILNVFMVLPSSMPWLFWRPDPSHTIQMSYLSDIPFLGEFANTPMQIVYLVMFVLCIALYAPMAALNAMWDPVMLMRTFPHSRYGQFCATNAVWRAVGGMIGGGTRGRFS